MIIEEFVRNILNTSYETFDQPTIIRTKNHILDVIGCIMAGVNDRNCSSLARLVSQWGGKAESTVLAHGIKAPACSVAMVNGMMARAFDFDPIDINVRGVNYPSHISATNVPVALAMAEACHSNGKELITALILGDDISARMRVASDSSNRPGWDSTGTLNVFGATAVAGNLARLNESQLMNAFGIAISQLAGTFQGVYDGVSLVKLHSGLGARAGIFSVQVSLMGLPGVKDPLFGKYGYYDLYSRNLSPGVLVADLGRNFYSDTAFKPYPSCRGTHSAVDCALEIVHKYEFQPGDINKITIKTGPGTQGIFAFLGQPFSIGIDPQVSAGFSLQYTVANALFRKEVRLEHFTEEFIRNPEFTKFLQKVEIPISLPAGRSPTAAEVVVSMQDGRVFAAQRDIPSGDSIRSPLSEKEIRDKFRTNTVFSRKISKDNAEQALKLVDGLDRLDNISELVNLLVPET
jgi:2-methylcitrate dehydratase PrpD